MALTGKIVEWNGARGFGYLEHEGRRIFLHIRDFTGRPRTPEPGDPVTFVLGADRQGRPCAQQAVFLGAAGRIKAMHLLILIFLLLPSYAIYRLLGTTGLGFATGWMAIISALTYQVYATDKRQAQKKGQRESEVWLHWLELLGGWPGAFFAQRRLRHKSSKGTYQFVFVLIIGLHQFLAIDALRGWPFLKLVSQGLQKL